MALVMLAAVPLVLYTLGGGVERGWVRGVGEGVGEGGVRESCGRGGG